MSKRSKIPALPIALLVVAAGWTAGWLARVAFDSPNVDDYLYSGAALSIWQPLSHRHPLGFIRAILTTGQNAPIVPTLASPLSLRGPDVAVLVQLGLLLLLACAVFAIMSEVTSASRAAVSAVVTCLLPAVLGWSLMVHMALAAGTISLAAIAMALKSDGFRKVNFSLAFGGCVGLLALSRSMAPVYVVCLVIATGLTAVIFHRSELSRANFRNTGLAAATCIAIGAPWWIVSGRTALHWLLTAGYSGSSGMIQTGNRFANRLTWTVDEWGVLTVLIFGMIVLSAGWLRMRPGQPDGMTSATRRVQAEALTLLLTFASLVIAALASSNNAGTGFPMPALVATSTAVAMLAATGGHILWNAYAVSGLGLAILSTAQMSVGVGLSTPPGTTSWVPSPPYELGALSALGNPDRNRLDHSSSINASLIGQIREGWVWIARDDEIVNANSVSYYKSEQNLGGYVDTPTYDPAVQVSKAPMSAQFVIAGTSCAPFHQNVDDRALEASLAADGYVEVIHRQLSYCNVITLWRH